MASPVPVPASNSTPAAAPIEDVQTQTNQIQLVDLTESTASRSIITRGRSRASLKRTNDESNRNLRTHLLTSITETKIAKVTSDSILEDDENHHDQPRTLSRHIRREKCLGNVSNNSINHSQLSDVSIDASSNSGIPKTSTLQRRESTRLKKNRQINP